MAVRSTKICRDVINSCKQLIAHKSDIVSVSCNREHHMKDAAAAAAEHEETTSTLNEDQSDSIRYIVTNTQRPEMLPKIEFPKSPEQLIPPEMRHLQPAMLPKFMELREDPENCRWELKENVGKSLNCPFPEPIKELRTETITVSDKQKAELKLPNSSIQVRFGNMSTSFNRSFSTAQSSPSSYVNVNVIPMRSMASNERPKKPAKGSYDHRAHCDSDAQKVVCDPARKKVGGCPRFIINECAQSRGSDCRHQYIDPKCKKKNAPYPSYSESCAERLEEDPSECLQCPWQKCGGVEGIKPQKRKYHQMVASKANAINSSTLTPLYSPAILDLDYNCDASKEPCKRPPTKCDLEKDAREREKEWRRNLKIERTGHVHKDPPKRKFSIIDDYLYASKDQRRIRGKLPFDKNLGDYEYVRKRKCGHDRSQCKKKKRRIVPDDCFSDDCKRCDQCHEVEVDVGDNLLMSILNYECKSKNPKQDCPPLKITPVPQDHSQDNEHKPADPCCKEGRKGTKLSDRRRWKRPKVVGQDHSDEK